MLLKDKKILVTGVLTRQSIAYAAAMACQRHGAEIILTGGPGKSSRLTERVAATLEPAPPVIPMDVTDPEQINETVRDIKKRWGSFDGLFHSIGYAPQSCLGKNFSGVPWADVSRAFQVSAYSLSALAHPLAPMMKNGSIVAMDFDASAVWIRYNWMGVCKAGLESISRYLAAELGPRYDIRVNCIAAGPVRTLAAKAIPEFEVFERMWEEKSILEWSLAQGAEEVANTAVFLFSDLSRKITGEKIHVDGGFHIMGSPVPREQLRQEAMETSPPEGE